MVYEVFARKWRPQVFEDVIGQEHITQTLINAIKSDRVAHAYLFSGARGVGKTSVARILAKALNCKQGAPGIPCNQCPSCLEITQGSSMDVQEIDGASNRGIDEIRNLRDNIKFMPSGNRFRVYIIDEVHMLTLPAFNALLKTLEEPPAHVKFIFATTDPHKVPITILSRCQRFDFKRIPLNRLISQLQKITAEEGIEITPNGMLILAREADGSMRDAESLLDQIISYAGQKVTDQAITDILGVIDHALLFEITAAILADQPAKCIELIDRIYNFGYDLKEFYRALMDQFRNLLVGLLAPDGNLLDLAESEREELRKLAETTGQERLHQSLHLLIAKEGQLRLSAHPRLVLETIVIKLCGLGSILTLDELLRKIGDLEKRLAGGSIPLPSLPAENRVLRREKSLADPISQEKKHEPAEPQHDENWEGLLQYIASKNKPMANVLKKWHLRQWTGDLLEIAGGDDSFSAGYLDEAGRLEKLEGFAAAYFKRPVKIKPITAAPNKEAAKPAPEGKKTPKIDPNKNEHTQPVRNILDLFQGEVKQEKTKDEG